MAFAWTAFCSSLLLFLIQPIAAKAILPFLGGSAGVWTTAMLFFQVLLLLGYVYADWLTRRLRPQVQTAIHLSLVALSLLQLPIAIRPPAETSTHPALQVLKMLAVSVGLPYLLLSSTSPMVQVWRARKSDLASAYKLFSVSNAASLIALLSYPFVIEPLVGTQRQMQAWSAGYAGFALLCAGSAWLGRKSGAAVFIPPARVGKQRIARRESALYLVLAACPSILWLSVSNTLSQHVASIPFLWILPLATYLMTLVLAFHSGQWYRPSVYRWLLPAGWVLFTISATRQGFLGLGWNIGLFVLALSLCCMFCHGELARRKPPAKDQLTPFYVTVAAGGALGGVFVGVVAPAVFNQLLELPIGAALCMVLAAGLLYRFPIKRIARLALFATLGLIAVTRIDGTLRGTRLRERNFYGVLEIRDRGTGDDAIRDLFSGPVRHGFQFLSPARRRLPTGYYSPGSGIGALLRSRGPAPVRVGVIGLGAGTLAAYGRPGDHYRFYEINPAVIRAARSDFTFLSDSPSEVAIVPGDGRLSLEHESNDTFDVLVVDAFSGDSIPVHLLTREAFATYFSQMKPGGILAVHVTNLYLDLAPVAAALAASYHREAKLVRNPAASEPDTEASDWILIAPSAGMLEHLPVTSTPLAVRAQARPWTDNYSNLFRVLR